VAGGKKFDFADLRSQLEQVRRMGGMSAVMDKLPAQLAGKQLAGKGMAPEQADVQVRRQIAMIDSMTLGERRVPAIIDGSRRRRIARGAGVQVQDVNRLLKQFLDMQRMMKQLKGGPLRRLLGGLKTGL